MTAPTSGPIPELFRLKEDLSPEVVAGVPPDAFSETGQRWGNPLYDWDALRARGYDWWIERMRWAIETCDIVRLDHFRGFEAYWEIPADEPTAVNGRWVKGPNDACSKHCEARWASCRSSPKISATSRTKCMICARSLEIPGMKILQFGFGNPGAHVYLPHQVRARLRRLHRHA